VIPDNWWYGHNQVLSAYCGRDPAPIFGSVVHGWWADYAQGGHRRLSAAPLLVWTDAHRAQALGRGVPNVVAIGAPFVYLASMLDAGVGSAPVGAGTLCFPFHGGDASEVDQDYAELIAEVEAHEPGPYTASIFYQDLDRPGLRARFDDAGWRVVSFGTRADPLFLHRLHAEVLAHRSVVADRVGSAIWYAGLLGRRVRVLGPRPSVRVGGAVLDDGDRLRWPELHGAGLDAHGARAAAELELGAGCRRSPDELARILGWGTWRAPVASVLAKVIDWREGTGVRRGELRGP
jgi:hypothetical protein